MRRERKVICHYCGFRYRPTETRHAHLDDGTVVTEPRKDK